jgi:hypothetical protein
VTGAVTNIFIAEGAFLSVLSVEIVPYLGFQMETADFAGVLLVETVLAVESVVGIENFF